MKVTQEQYTELTKNASCKSKSWIDIPLAFLIGGLICCLGQGLFNLYQYFGLEEKEAYTVASVTLIFISALLTGLRLYGKIAKFGGAGTLVPITGFANAVVSPAIEFKSEGYILGIGAKIFIISGPVILYGCVASIIYGIIYFFIK